MKQLSLRGMIAAATLSAALVTAGCTMDKAAKVPAQAFPDQGSLPNLAALTNEEHTSWINSAPLSNTSLHGKVVLIDFWTYSCINSLRNLPYIQSWAAKYKNDGLVVIGVHSPEFGFEHDRGNIGRAARDLEITFPIAIDSEYAIWNAFNNGYWPADYLIDGNGRIRYHHFGEGDYAATERAIQELLRANGASNVATSFVGPTGKGVAAPPSEEIQSPETYVGYRRAESFSSPQRLIHDEPANYSAPSSLELNHWALSGRWNDGAQPGVLESMPGAIRFRFHSRDVHLVMGPGASGAPVRFVVKLDGRAPGENHGVDTAPDGTGTVTWPRMYQLIRQKGAIVDRTVEIEFLDPGIAAYVFTFG
jgi:thiol-disulfide isomerase/thioredoxin